MSQSEPFRAGHKLTPKELEKQIEVFTEMIASRTYGLVTLRQDFENVDEKVKSGQPEDRYSFWPGSARYGVPMRVRHALYMCELIKRGAA